MKTLVVTKDPFRELNRSHDLYIKASGSTITYQTPFGKMIYLQGSGLRTKDFGMFAHVEKNARNAVRNGTIEMPEFKPKFSTFYDSCNDVDICYDIYEIDLNGAYWHEALDLGLVDRYMFDRYNTKNKTDKLVRNISIGRLAGRFDFFESKKGEKPKYINSERRETYPAFWKVAAGCDKKIRSCIGSINRDDVLFYWVDALFVLGTKSMKNSQEFFLDNGIPIKTKRVKITRIGKKIFVNCGREIKKYSLPVKPERFNKNY